MRFRRNGGCRVAAGARGVALPHRHRAADLYAFVLALCLRPLCLCAGRNKVLGERRAFAEEITVHLLYQEFLRFLAAHVDPILIHEPLHVLHPHFPGFLGNAVVDLRAEWMALERDFVKPLHVTLELHAKDLMRPWPDGIAKLIDSASAATASHVSISLSSGY